MADREIYAPKNSPNLVPWVWGERHYYYNCHHEGGDFDWFRDNLSAAEGSPAPEAVTPAWTFGGKWNPEEEMTPVLPFVSLPYPRQAAYNVKRFRVSLHWISARNAVSHNVHFGKDGTPAQVKNQKMNSFDVDGLSPRATYYWRIDEVTESDTLYGPLWHFTTE
jgi:hypothetical protein